MELQNDLNNEEIKTSPFINRFLTKGFNTGKNKGWMYWLGILAAFFGYLSFQLIMMIPLVAAAARKGISFKQISENPNILFNPDALGINRSLLLALMMGMFVFTLLFFWLFIKYVQKKPLSSIITGFEKVRWNRYFFSFGVWSILLISLTFVSYFAAPSEMELHFEAGKFSILLLVGILLIPIQTATEELLFRGYLMQGLSQYVIQVPRFLAKLIIGSNPESFNRLESWLSQLSTKLFRNGIFPLIATSILFGIMHGSNPEAKAHGLLIMMPYYIFFGAFLAMLTLLDEGLELAMGIHCANNLMSSLLICSKNSVLQTDAIFYTSAENPGGEFMIWVIMASICFFILYKKYKLYNWNLLIR